MKILLLCLVVFFPHFVFCQKLVQATPATLKEESGYRLRVGDKVSVRVLNESDCTVQQTIRDDGNIRLTYLGELKVVNQSIKTLESLIAQEYVLRQIFLKPTINVSITEYSKRYVYLSGSVNKKGPFALPPEVEAMNIVELISMSGGFTAIARKNKVYVTRTFYTNEGLREQKTFEVNVELLSRGSTQNRNDKFWIYPEDQINVPERLF